MRHLALERSLTDRTYDAILDAICDGELPAGARVNQDELAAKLNVSRQPIVQALALLKVQGFVRETGRRGVVVAPLDRGNIRASLRTAQRARRRGLPRRRLARQRGCEGLGTGADQGGQGGNRLRLGQAHDRGGHALPPLPL